MSDKFVLSAQIIENNVQQLKQFLKSEGLEAFYISSFDEFLSEYVPREESHRYYLTGFTGSVAEVLVLPDQKLKLYVDGRYHEQADMEVNHDIIEVVKCKRQLQTELLEDLEKIRPRNIGIEAERTPLKFYRELQQRAKVKVFSSGELGDVIKFTSYKTTKPVSALAPELRDQSAKEKIENRLGLKEGQAYYLSALDEVSWLTNSRGHHLPFLSSYMAKGLVHCKAVHVFVDPSIEIEKSAQDEEGVVFHQVKASDREKVLREIQSENPLKEVFINPANLTVVDYNLLKECFGEDALKEKEDGIIPHLAIKTPYELSLMEKAFERADEAIYQTLKETKEKVAKGEKVSERDLADAIWRHYQKTGAVNMSFNPIAGIGPNSSIMHYGNPSKDITMKNDSLVLLDSGAYYDSGLATDTTRTFIAGDAKEVDDRYKKIYTLVLKGLLQCQNAVFPEGVMGSVLDGLARAPMMREGYNFPHGTGHGVGVHVHESGVRLSPISTKPMKAGQVVSIEPGIYIPNFGGVRLENIAVVEKHPQYQDMLYFRSLVFIGFEPTLIDESILTSEEKKWLEDYEFECSRRGRSFR